MEEFKQQLRRRGGLDRVPQVRRADDSGAAAAPQPLAASDGQDKKSDEPETAVAGHEMPTTPTAALMLAPLGDASVIELNDENSFDSILREWIGREHGRVSAKVMEHTEAVWGVAADLAAARRRLLEEAAKLVVSGLAASTRASYKSACRTYEFFSVRRSATRHTSCLTSSSQCSSRSASSALRWPQ